MKILPQMAIGWLLGGAVMALSSCGRTYEVARLSIYAADNPVQSGGQYYAAPEERREMSFSAFAPQVPSAGVIENTLALTQKAYGSKCVALADVVMVYSDLYGAYRVSATPIYKR